LDSDKVPELEELKKESGNMTMETYIEKILKPHVLPHHAHNPDIILEVDGDSAHGGRSAKNRVQKFKDQNGMRWYCNPPSSPDLSIIEDCWRYLKQHVKKHKSKSVQQLKWAIDTEWENMPMEYINKLVDSMPDRIHEVVKRKGLSSQY
jgi:transposase